MKNTENGEIKSPNYPNPYNNLEEIVWIIQGPIGRRVQFQVIKDKNFMLRFRPFFLHFNY